jgi:signal transduction histidine kinase
MHRYAKAPQQAGPPIQPARKVRSEEVFGFHNDVIESMINEPDSLWRKLKDLPGVRSWKILSDSLFLITSFAVGLFCFIVLTILFAVGGALAIVGVGIPILVATFALVMYLAQLERSRIRVFMGANIPSPYREISRDGNIVKRAWRIGRSAALWRDTVFLFLMFPIGIISLFLVSLPVSFVLTPFITLLGGTNTVLIGWEVNSFGESIVALGVGATLLLPMSMLINLAALVHVEVAQRFLGSSVEEVLTERVEELTESRSAVMRAMHLERRRIERDLHDGAQQRLVSLAMELGLAREKLDTDPEGARRLIEESHEDAKQVLQELRELVRGIHPAVLTDRGLDAAISAVAGRSPIPVGVDVSIGDRQPDEVEGTAYFVVVEALTNIAKHSGATEANVSLKRERGWLKVLVEDNGRGGADPEKGTGLKGLRDRILALDGKFRLESPVGQGTRVLVEIPCE